MHVVLFKELLYSGFTPGTPVFAHYTSARRWYAPPDSAKVNNIEIERVTEMDKKKHLRYCPSLLNSQKLFFQTSCPAKMLGRDVTFYAVRTSNDIIAGDGR